MVAAEMVFEIHDETRKASKDIRKETSLRRGTSHLAAGADGACQAGSRRQRSLQTAATWCRGCPKVGLRRQQSGGKGWGGQARH